MSKQFFFYSEIGATIYNVLQVIKLNQNKFNIDLIEEFYSPILTKQIIKLLSSSFINYSN